MRNRYLSGVSRWASPLCKQYYGVVVATGTQIRLCFSTNGTEKIYLLGYGVLY